MVPIVGRNGELAQLRALTEEVRATGVGRMVAVTGERGIGKSQLCAALSRQLVADGTPVAWSRCWGDAPPRWPWPDVVAELGRSTGRPPPSGAGGSTDRFGALQEVVDQLRQLTAAGPAVAIVDDLHLADPDALLLTRFVVRSLHRFPLLVVVTWRTDPTIDPEAPGPGGLARDATAIELGPIAAADLCDFVLALGGDPAIVTPAADLLAVTGGNPMYLAELVRHPAMAGRAGVLESGLRHVVQRRVGALREPARTVLGAAAVLGDHPTVGEVAVVVRADPAAVLAAVTRSACCARVEDGRVEFTNDLFREACLEALEPVTRLELHAAAASSVGGSDAAGAVRRARHAVAAAPVSAAHRQAAIAAGLGATAALTRALAFDQAAEWGATASALAATGSAPGVEASARLAHADAVLACGRLDHARRLYEQVVLPAEESGDPRLLARAALGLCGVWVEEVRDELARRRALGLCRRALAALEPDDLLAARLEVRLAAEQAYDGNPLHLVRQAVDRVRRTGDGAATAEALSLYHHTLLAPAHAERRLEIADELLDVASRVEGSIFPLFGLCWRTVDLYLLGDSRAEASFANLRQQATVLGSESIGYIVAVLEVMRTFRRGELDRAEELAGEALTLGHAAGDADALGYFGGHLLGIRWAQGRLGEMVDAIRQVIDSATLRRRDRTYPALLACALAHRDGDGDRATARALLDGLVAEGLDDLAHLSTGLGTFAVLVETAAALGDVELAADLADRLAPFAHLPVMPSLAVVCIGPGEAVLGLALATAGRHDEAERWYRAALRANERLQSRPFEALIRARLAAALVSRGRAADRDEAAALYGEAIAIGREIGLSCRVAAWQESAAGLSAPGGGGLAIRGRIERGEHGWTVEIGDRAAVVDHVVGLHYVAELIAHHDSDIAATQLSAALVGAPALTWTSLGAPVLDAQARADYERRLGELDRELDVADRLGDAARGERAARERQFLVDELRAGAGLGGRPRRLSDDAERCRMRVSKAIRRAITRVAEVDDVLGRALDLRIRTGHVCRYVSDTDQPIEWTVRLHHAPSR